MQNKTINLGVVAEIAQALGELNDSVVFVGGAVISVYVDDAAADEIRPTQDVDLTLKLFDISQQDLDQQLAKLGFNPDMQSEVICSYKYRDIAVDIMAAQDTMRGPSNRWYAVGFDSLQTVEVNNMEIQILSAPCFLATKFEAYNHRGNDDYRTSHDFEDIVYVLDNRTTIIDEIGLADERVKEFICDELTKIISNPYSEEILTANLHPLIVKDRYPMLLEKIMHILKLTNRK